MHIHYLQHVPFEGPGHIAQWARRQGHGLSATALYAGQTPPEPGTFDLLVIMGGPMGVYDTDRYDWLRGEKYFLEGVLKAEKPVLGICLGAQLMADVLGARVYPSPHKEIGWFAVDRIHAAEDSPFGKIFPDRFHAFHWHGDTFDLPQSALHLARSEACRHQAFYYPPAALGLQFHLESTEDSIAALITHCGPELVPAPYIQSAADIGRQDDRIAPSNGLMENILNSFQADRFCGGTPLR